MAKVEKVTQFWVQIPKRIGSWAKAMSAVADAGINGRAYVGWEEKKRGILLLVTNDPRKTERALTKAKPKLRFKKEKALAVTMKNRRGSGKRLANALAEAEISVTGVHASAVGTGNYLTIIATDNNAKAEKVIKAL